MKTKLAAFLVASCGAVVMACLPARGQPIPRFEAGFRGGAGQYDYSDDRTRTRGVFGAEVCAFCSGRYALFGGYSRFLPPGGSSHYQSADQIGLGLRIQGRRQVRPFFDIGLAVGYSRFDSGIYARSTTTAGAELGGGVTFLVGPSLYIRPQVRLCAMSEVYVAASGEVGIGWRF